MSRSLQFIAVLEDSVNAARLSQIWQDLQAQFGVDQEQLQISKIKPTIDTELQDLMEDNNDDSSKKCILCIELMEGKMEHMRKALAKAGCHLLKLIKIPTAFRSLGGQIPSQIMRDQF
ncbi:hypothetical protein [Nonlabens xiamenensis]|uniref:hypothetical protein n=1 Tax=Nonlabens xiamenensis TaxID=2341043 RepID=UPI000F608B27|nr:hypothetical protein [Nonlabens xiamenensis]